MAAGITDNPDQGTGFDLPLNRLTLRFSSDETESAFMADWGERSLRTVRTVLVLAAILYLLFGILDRWITPEEAGTIWIIRLVVCLFIASGYAMTFHPLYRKRMQVMLSAVGCIIGLGIVAMVAVAKPEGGYHYYAGLLLAIPYIHGLMRLRFSNATVVTLVLLSGYLIVAIAFKSTPLYLRINNMFFLASASILGMFTSYALELSWRRVFLQQRGLEEKRKLLEAEYRRKTLELEAARRLQIAMLPQEVPSHPRVTLAVSMTTASEVGGDYYDFLQPEDGGIVLIIGDATGHGAQAGAMVAATKLFFTGVSGTEDLPEILSRGSVALRHVGKSRLFMALGLVRFRDGIIEAAGAGMPPALLYRKRRGTVEQIPLKGVPLGAPLRHKYRSATHTVETGDVLLLVSDGLPELRNQDGAELGGERLSAHFEENAGLAVDQILKSLQRISREWRGTRPLHDDITCMAMKVTGTLRTGPEQI